MKAEKGLVMNTQLRRKLVLCLFNGNVLHFGPLSLNDELFSSINKEFIV